MIRKWSETKKEEAEYTQYRETIESTVDLDSFIGIKESAELNTNDRQQANNVTTIGSAIESRKRKPLQERLHEKELAAKQQRDQEVKERIKLKTDEYNASPSSHLSAGSKAQSGMDVVVGLDEEVNELLSMAKIYCSAGKYSEARAILGAQHREDSDPRLIDALEQIDKLERDA
jgi:hypothetical protein